ncbi:hypothetical protein [Candidatus Berkiella aquae]|uniref:Uncharacterized protein n=1 Tax=Candidatus Berkiella aquae TaxID=295108 RepID=A0A0Q9YKX4_9GAMM|nr:hypothetical protein [Candidatus Berkiella aquae]MCS5710917.1 hypothetical protein [Candidatus Berkiella aquae]
MLADFNDYNDSGKTITYYFNTTAQRANRSRYSHYVLLPVIPQFIANPKNTLDFDSNELFSFAAKTIQSLKNNSKNKVFPIPLLTDTQTQTTAQLSSFQLTQCASIIKAEKQYTPTFVVVGHGSPLGIGFLDPEDQIAPEVFAEKIEALFKNAELNFYTKPFHIAFETCNSAFAAVSTEMTRNEALQQVMEQSFIGRFYNRMCELGYTEITVTGYRGYFCSINTKKSSAARVQNSFCKPTIDLDSKQGQYVIYNGQCQSPCHDEYLAFPVEVSMTAMKEVTEKLTKLSL